MAQRPYPPPARNLGCLAPFKHKFNSLCCCIFLRPHQQCFYNWDYVLLYTMIYAEILITFCNI
jgi:hypothetical protein